MNISDLRLEIDRIDDEIIRLINKRFDIVGVVKDYKFKKYGDEFLYLNEEREGEILKKNCSRFSDLGLDPSLAYGVWRNIISAANRFEQSDLTVNYSQDISKKSLQIIQTEYPNTLIHRAYSDLLEVNISSSTIVCLEIGGSGDQDIKHLEENGFSCYRRLTLDEKDESHVGFFGKIIK